MTDTRSRTSPSGRTSPYGRRITGPATLAAVLALAAGAAIAGCSTSGGSHQAGSGGGATTGQPPAASDASAAAGGAGDASGAGGGSGGGGPATADVTVTGAVSGHLDSPTKGPKYTCGTPTYPDLFSLYDVEGTVGGTRYALQISVNNFTGSGQQTGQIALTLAPTSGGQQFSSINATTQPTVVMTDKQSGTFTGDLGTADGAGSTAIHLKGSFHC